MFKSALLCFNISKSRNFGQMIRTADALGVTEIIVIGRKTLKTYGNFGTYDSRIQKHFFSLKDAANYLHENQYTLMGIEINEKSINIEEHPFTGNTAFLPGNEGSGLSQEYIALCDQLVYIKQFGSGASLNVNVATGIVLHHFATWAKFVNNPITKQKFKPTENT